MTAPLTRFARRRIFMAALALLACGTAAPTVQAAQVRAIPAAPLSSFLSSEFTDHRGRRQPLSQWKGKILVVNFWATWCPPCREETPILSRLQTKHASNGVQIVGIALDTADNVAQYAAIHPTSYPLFTGDANATNLSRLLGNTQLALPYTVVFNRDGVTEMNRLGRFSEAELDSLLEKIVRR